MPVTNSDRDGQWEMGTKDTYFRTPGLLWIILILLGMASLIVIVVRPDIYPYDYLGPLGRLTLFLVQKHPDVLKGILGMAVVLHSLEAIFAFRLARSKNIDTKQRWMWSFQTLLFGIASLKYLLSYKPEKLKNN